MSDLKAYQIYLKRLLLHKWLVWKAGLIVGQIPLWRLIIHDLSKFTRIEFVGYAKNFHGKMEGDSQEAITYNKKLQLDFAYAWLHHEGRNPHHWGYWIARSGKFTGERLDMPTTYVREMICDWMAAGRSHGNSQSWDMTSWLNRNLSLDKMSQTTLQRIEGVLTELGYICSFSYESNEFKVKLSDSPKWEDNSKVS